MVEWSQLRCMYHIHVRVCVCVCVCVRVYVCVCGPIWVLPMMAHHSGVKGKIKAYFVVLVHTSTTSKLLPRVEQLV